MKHDFVWMEWPKTRKLIAAFTDAHAELRFVGGAVRDSLLGMPIKDIDAATPLQPRAVMELLMKAGIRAIPTGIDHGTVTAVLDGRSFEITTLRRDTVCDGRHAAVEYTGDWKEDAARRDFTMNALYLSPAGELFDYFGGVDDLRAGIVRFIGDATERIQEDYLRILRFFRFYAWYDAGDADEVAVTACAVLARHMDKLSGERIQQEMLKLLAAPQPSRALGLMQAHSIMPHVLGFGLRNTEIFSRLETIERELGAKPEPIVRLAAFLLAIGAYLAEDEALDILSGRFKLSAQTTRELHIVVEHRKLVHPKITEAQQKRALRRLGVVNFKRIVMLNWAHGDESISALHPYMDMLALAENWEHPEFPIDGDDLIRLGIEPGKAMGDILRQLEDEWENNHYSPTKEQLLKKAGKLF